VIEKIAELKELPTEVVEHGVFENTIRLFSLPITK
jgi:Tat protein secretion system quality control protein TatD with DNase activity